MFKYSFEILEKAWNEMSDFWDELPTISPGRKIERFHKAEERFIVNFIKKHIKNKRPFILDLGCGTGRCLKILYKNGFKNLYGIDISSKMLKKCRSSLPTSFLLHHDFRERLPFEDDFFDVILIMGNTLTSGGLVESDLVLKQAYRVLKGSGFLIVGEYNAKFMTEDFVRKYYAKFPLEFEKFDKKHKTVYFSPPMFSHWVTERELKNLIEKARFRVISIKRKGIGLIVIAKK
jgi:ubiquinone/menaquinone biosynthesis C-methylase UbiE